MLISLVSYNLELLGLPSLAMDGRQDGAIKKEK